MNLTQELEKKIEAERAGAADREKAENAKLIYEAVVRNPWSEKHLNVTRQMLVSVADPATAQVLRDFHELPLDQVLARLPKAVRESCLEIGGKE